MNIYTGPVFDMAREQFHTVADYLGIPEGERDRLLYPKRAITVSVPVHTDDGRTAEAAFTLAPTPSGVGVTEVVPVCTHIGCAVVVRGSVSARGMSISRSCGVICIQVGMASARVMRNLPGLTSVNVNRAMTPSRLSAIGSAWREIWLPMQ